MPDLTKKHSEIKELIRKRSPFNKQETDRILNGNFATIPAEVKILVQKYQFGKKTVLDVGCEYGQSFLYWSENSEGIEIRDRAIRFLKALNKTVHKLNVEDEFLDPRVKKFDAVFNNNLIEHLVSPHLFLARAYSILKPGGILAIGHPIIPPLLFRKLWKLFGYHGWLGVEHINFFTPETAKLTLERAGFRIKEQYFPKASQMHPTLGKICAPTGIRLLSICQRVDNFKYPSKRLSEFDPSWASGLKHFR